MFNLPPVMNPFPDFLVYSLLAPFFIRIVVGFVFINLGALSFRNEKRSWEISLKTLNIPSPQIAVKILGAIELAGGIMLVLGFYTQIAALVLALLTFAECYVEYKDPAIIKRNFVFYLLVLSILLSLLFSGAGAFAIDLPL